MSIDQQTRQLTFEIMTEPPLPIGEQVFITGNCIGLGEWDPMALPLTRIQDRVWTGTTVIPAKQRIEYKITRGSWKSEETLADGTAPGNRAIDPGNDHKVKHVVKQWKDWIHAPLPQITGNYRIHETFHSRFLRFDRKIIVWLPPSYETETDRRYPVLYIQDGQQVFDPKTSTWQHDWQVDEWCTQLIAEHRLQEIIVVAIYSTEDRFLEYSPALAGKEYAQFITDELKPFIDSTYRTNPEQGTTAIAGASMGATIAFYLAWTRPDIFIGAVCLSSAFRFKNDSFDLDLVRETKEIPPLKIYLYCGKGDATEKELISGTEEMANLLRKRGFKDGVNMAVTYENEGLHNEATWAKHTDKWLLFLFGT